ncbi:flagellar export chaperone FlgN [Pelotomaculum propionicicum]|uniref:flagellar export chaperone FlgN n=1 Tax=Pelotomaculum propionicicum TaxID=258475 RepID=UPI003B7DA32D
MLKKIYELKKQKIKLMEEIYKTTLEQSQYLIPEKIDDLLVIIDKKQEFINTINEINAELLPLEENVSNSTEKSGGEEANKIYEENLEVIRILGERAKLLAVKIRKLEDQNLKMVSGEFESLKGKIKSLNQRKGSVQAYRGTPVQRDGCFIDNRK